MVAQSLSGDHGGNSDYYAYVNGVLTLMSGSTGQPLTPTPAPTPAPTTQTPTPTTPQASPTMSTATAQVVPGVPQAASQINVADISGQFALEPSLLLAQDDPSTPVNESMELSDRLPVTTSSEIAAGTVDPNAPKYQIDPTGVQAQTTNAPTSTAATPSTANQPAAGVQTALTADQVAAQEMQAAQGQLSTGSTVDPNSVTGQLSTDTQTALGTYAAQNISNIIDTSTMAGKLLAQQLGEGNYTDSKATLKGQLDILQSEFFDPATGDAKIPSWAAGTYRAVGRIAAFRGMTGTAAVTAMAQAMMEASVPIAQQDAAFFQTLTVENLNNKQEATINKANVLAKLDLQNIDNRMAAAINNSQAFLKMDMANLDNEQQTRVINTQARIQSILEDAKAENTNRLFLAESQNEKDMFYDNLSSAIEQFNAAQSNAMSQFNAGEVNDTSQFNAELENAREQFYTNMQFAIDTANAKWRQELTLTENQQQFEAAATDVKNLVGISVEQLNQLWDRADALLDYAWKSADNTADRNNKIALVKLQGDIALTQAEQEGFGNILGTILGAGASALFGWLF